MIFGGTGAPSTGEPPPPQFEKIERVLFRGEVVSICNFSDFYNYKAEHTQLGRGNEKAIVWKIFKRPNRDFDGKSLGAQNARWRPCLPDTRATRSAPGPPRPLKRDDYIGADLPFLLPCK